MCFDRGIGWLPRFLRTVALSVDVQTTHLYDDTTAAARHVRLVTLPFHHAYGRSLPCRRPSYWARIRDLTPFSVGRVCSFCECAGESTIQNDGEGDLQMPPPRCVQFAQQARSHSRHDRHHHWAWYIVRQLGRMSVFRLNGQVNSRSVAAKAIGDERWSMVQHLYYLVVAGSLAIYTTNCTR
jgi:hypothetical protein